jgi:hypothetical protein
VKKGIFALGLILAIVGFGGDIAAASGIGIPLISSATSSAADQDFYTISQIQVESIDNDGRYAPSRDSLRSGILGHALPTTNGRELSYSVSEDGAHYIEAEQITGSKVRVASDTAKAITCDRYTPTCIAHVTADPGLIAALPFWASF